MNVFEAVKQSVTTRQAAEHYGIRVNRNGMACCPFHNDKTPSMKLDKRFHCFGCGADGDVIDFVAALYGLGKKEAAAQLASDFGLAYEDWKPPGRARKPKPRQKSPEEQFREAKAHCFRVLADYLHLLMETEIYLDTKGKRQKKNAENQENAESSNNIEGTSLSNASEDNTSTEEINKKTRTPFYPKEWKDSFGLPVEEHKKALEINMLKGYAEFTTPK